MVSWRSRPHLLVALNAANTASGVPLVLVPGISGFQYSSNFAAKLLADVPFYAYSFGMGNNALSTVEDIARKIADLIDSQLPNTPVHIAGHSAGGFIALELSHVLSGRGRQVRRLILLDQLITQGRVCDRPEYHQTRSDGLSWSEYGAFRTLYKLCRESLPGISLDDYLELDRSERLERSCISLKPPGVNLDVCRHWVTDLLGLTITNYEAVNTYLPRPYEGPAVAICGTDNKAWRNPKAWQPIFGSRIRIVEMPGGHDMFAPNRAEELASAIRTALAE
jgi:thioesterase domain-containing protein